MVFALIDIREFGRKARALRSRGIMVRPILGGSSRGAMLLVGLGGHINWDDREDLMTSKESRDVGASCI